MASSSERPATDDVGYGCDELLPSSLTRLNHPGSAGGAVGVGRSVPALRELEPEALLQRQQALDPPVVARDVQVDVLLTRPVAEEVDRGEVSHCKYVLELGVQTRVGNARDQAPRTSSSASRLSGTVRFAANSTTFASASPPRSANSFSAFDAAGR